MDKKIKVGITQGDFNGIGLEVALKAVADDMITELFTPVIFADSRLIRLAANNMNIELPEIKFIEKPSDARHGVINVVDLKLSDTTLQAGHATHESGTGALASIDAALKAITDSTIDVLVTAPVSKEACASVNPDFSGHTEYLNNYVGDDHRAQMILFDEKMRVALVTTHVPVSQIAAKISEEEVYSAIKGLASTLKRDFTISVPKIAVLSLNPHVGDGGMLGTEEKDVIVPAIEQCREEGIQVFGPYAADGFFGKGAYMKFDAVLAMYHDQGLAPFKALASEYGVNYSAGLPFVRTSPDHGTAYDIAWRGIADPRSMREAIYKAIDIFRNRSLYDNAAANPLQKHSIDRHSKGDRQNNSQESKTIETEE